MPGPGKTPTKIKLIRGNPGKRPLPAAEPEFSPGDMSPPEWLCAKSKERWHPLARALDANGLLTEANREMLAGYVSVMTEFAEKVRETGKADVRLLQQIRLMAREFGFTPSSQAGIVAPGKVQADEKARFFG